MPLQITGEIYTLSGLNAETIVVLPDLRYAGSSASTRSGNSFFSFSITDFRVKVLDAFGVPLATSAPVTSTGFFEISYFPERGSFEWHALADGQVLLSWTSRSREAFNFGTTTSDAYLFDSASLALSSLVEATGYNLGASGLFVGMQSTSFELSNGNFVVVGNIAEQHNTPAAITFSKGVAAALYSRDGAKIAGATVPSHIDGNQSGPAVAELGGGRYVVLWTDDTGDDEGSAIEGRMFAATGVAAGDEFLLNATTAGDQRDVAADSLAGGGFVAVWEETRSSGPDNGNIGLRARLFDANGAARTGDIAVNTTTAGDQQHAAVLGLPNGGFVTAWIDTSAGTRIVAQEFDAGGSTIGGEIVVDSAAPSDAHVALQMTPDGRVLMTWAQNKDFIFGVSSSDGTVFARVLDARSAQHYGTTGADHVMGADSGALANNVFVGFEGDDAYYALGGADYGYMGAGDDLFFGGAGIDVAVGGTGIDTLRGGAEQDYLFGDEGNDQIFGEDGVDVLQGGEGDDALNGGTGGDYMYGGNGNDTGYGQGGNDIFVMDTGNDTAFGDDGQDYFYMGPGDDSMSGGAGVDVLLGETGNDTFDGGLDVDYLFLGPGGAGDNDTILVDINTTGVQVVNGFEAGGTNDVIRFSGSGMSSLANVMTVTSDFSEAGGFMVITLDADTSVWLIGVTPGSLTEADFLFG